MSVINMNERVAQRMNQHGSERLDGSTARAENSRSICAQVISSFLRDQPELISPAPGSSGQEWVGCCQKHHPFPSPLPCVLE